MSLPPDDSILESQLRGVLDKSAAQLHVPSPPPSLHRQGNNGRTWLRSLNRWPVVAATAVVSLVVAGGGYAVAEYATSTPATDRSTARCYSDLHLGHGNNFDGTTVAASGRPGTWAAVPSAVDTCRSLWEAGILAPGVARPLRSQLPESQRVVPSLVACVMADGRAAVFPGGPDTCRQLGLPSEEGG